MFVKFENKHVRLNELNKGVIVEYYGDYYHIQHVFKDVDDRIKITISGAFETFDVWPYEVVWLS